MYEQLTKSIWIAHDEESAKYFQRLGHKNEI